MAQPIMIVGDPYFRSILNPDTIFEFKGTPGTNYLALGDTAITPTCMVSFQVATCPSNPTKTYISQVAIAVGGISLNLAIAGTTIGLGLLGHTATIGLDTCKIDGTSMTYNSAAVTKGNLTVWWHTGAKGEKRIDVSYPGWSFGTIQDPGTDLVMHPTTSPICRVLHLGLFPGTYPSTSLKGLLYDGTATSNPATYAAMVN